MTRFQIHQAKLHAERHRFQEITLGIAGKRVLTGTILVKPLHGEAFYLDGGRAWNTVALYPKGDINRSPLYYLTGKSVLRGALPSKLARFIA